MATSDPRPCGDCGASPGKPHSDGCDVARCLVTGIQRLQCSARHDTVGGVTLPAAELLARIGRAS